MNELGLLITVLVLIIIISLSISIIYDNNKTEKKIKKDTNNKTEKKIKKDTNNKTEKKIKKDVGELNVAIKTTDPHTEGLSIIDFLYKTYNINFRKYNNIDEYKSAVLEYVFNNYSQSYWIICGNIMGMGIKNMYVIPDCDLQKNKQYCNDIIWFDNFSDFEKYIEGTID